VPLEQSAAHHNARKRVLLARKEFSDLLLPANVLKQCMHGVFLHVIRPYAPHVLDFESLPLLIIHDEGKMNEGLGEEMLPSEALGELPLKVL
jgi:hypothetical protein